MIQGPCNLMLVYHVVCAIRFHVHIEKFQANFKGPIECFHANS